MVKRVFRARHLVQWNYRMCLDTTKPITDKVVEAVLHQQMIPFQHTDEFRSLYRYDKLWVQLENYSPEFPTLARNEYLLAGRNQAFRLFARPESESKLPVSNLTASASELFNQLGIRGDKSAGLTAYGENKLEAFAVGLDKAVKILCDGKAPSPCLAGVRTQRKEKTRLVWMYPLEMTIIEALIARPLIDRFKGRRHVMTFGTTSHELGMRLRSSASNAEYHYSLDYSHFDASVNPFLIQCAFNAFRTWFDLSSEVYPGVTLAQVFDLVERYFITTPIVMPKRDSTYPVMVTGKTGGVPSGSYFTQLVDSFANVCLIQAASAKFSLHIADDNLYVLGDDCLFFCNVPSMLPQVSSFITSFGFKVNTSKGSHGLSTDRIEYLGRSWVNGYPLRTYVQVTRGALYPEKYRRYSKRAGVRQMEALGVVSSYLLTSYVEDPPVGTDKLKYVVGVSPHLTSGLTNYLMSEGLVPGKVFERAVY